MRKIIIILIASLLALIIGEVTLRFYLFRHVSYSNSESIDRQLQERNLRSDWNILFVGDSEIHWGINPEVIDAEFAKVGAQALSFNHAFDGFGVSWWPQLLPTLLAEPTLSNVKYVVVGVQMIDVHRQIGTSGDDCGALQRPVLTSPFGRDLGVNQLCGDQSWDETFAQNLFGGLWFVRYASAVRTLLLPDFASAVDKLRFNSRRSGESIRGFEPHRSIEEDQEFEGEFARWKAQYDADRDFKPLPDGAWDEMTSPGGFFDQLNETVRKQGKKLVLFALPTNPLLIDTFERRADYLKNSKSLFEWAQNRHVVFVDAGIQDVADPKTYFSDMRHLSLEGARRYSQELGQLLAQQEILKSDTPSTDN